MFRNIIHVYCGTNLIRMHFKYLTVTVFLYRDDYNATYSNDVTKFFCWLNFITEVCFLLVKILLKMLSN